MHRRGDSPEHQVSARKRETFALNATPSPSSVQGYRSREELRCRRRLRIERKASEASCSISAPPDALWHVLLRTRPADWRAQRVRRAHNVLKHPQYARDAQKVLERSRPLVEKPAHGRNREVRALRQQLERDALLPTREVKVGRDVAHGPCDRYGRPSRHDAPNRKISFCILVVPTEIGRLSQKPRRCSRRGDGPLCDYRTAYATWCRLKESAASGVDTNETRM